MYTVLVLGTKKSLYLVNFVCKNEYEINLFDSGMI